MEDAGVVRPTVGLKLTLNVWLGGWHGADDRP